MSERGPSYWVQQFGRNELPVLARTVEELERLRADADNLTPQRISALVLHDPLMTFKVLRYIQERRHRSQMVDITTISHALMMIGTDPFLGHFTHQRCDQSRDCVASRVVPLPFGREVPPTLLSSVAHCSSTQRSMFHPAPHRVGLLLTANIFVEVNTVRC